MDKGKGMVCRKCGFQNGAGCRFCGNCGSRLKVLAPKRRKWLWIGAVICGLIIGVIISVWKDFPAYSPGSSRNVLMPSSQRDVGGYSAIIFDKPGCEKWEIWTINFLDTLKDAPDTAWDVSEGQDGSVRAWVADGDLYIAANGKVRAPKNCEALFAEYRFANAINFNGNFDTSQATNMRNMFYYCHSLEALDVSDFDTSHVTDMSGMFYYCQSVKQLDLSKFDTSHVTDMSSMFNSCMLMEQLDLSSFDTSSVTDMSYMFDNMFLEELDLSGFDVSKVESMEGMFDRCFNLRKLNLSSFDTSGMPNMDGMFSGCNVLQELIVSDRFVVRDPKLFSGCEQLDVTALPIRWEVLASSSDEMMVQRALEEAADWAKQGSYRMAIQTLTEALEQTPNDQICNALAEYRQEFAIYNSSYAAAGEHNSIVVNEDGTTNIVGRNEEKELYAKNWKDITAVAMGAKHVVGLKTDGTVVAEGSNVSGRCDVGAWTEIQAIAVGTSHTVGLKKDGTLLATGYNEQGQCKVEVLMRDAGARKIAAVAAGFFHTLALLEDGTVVACGDTTYGACDVSGWQNIAAIYARQSYSVGLKADGTVVVTGLGVEKWDMSQFTDIHALALGDTFMIGLREDGTLVSVGLGDGYLAKQHEKMANWKDVAVIVAGKDQTVAIRSDGYIYCAGINNYHQCDLDAQKCRIPHAVQS